MVQHRCAMKPTGRLRTGRALPSVVAATTAAAISAFTVAGFVLQLASGGKHVTTAAPAALALAVGLLGCIIVWQQPGNRMGVLMAATGGAFAVAVLGAGLLDYGTLRGGVPQDVEQVGYAWVWGTGALTSVWALVILWFPDGRFASAAWRRYFVVAAAVCTPFVVLCYLFAPAGQVYSLFSGVVAPPGVGGPFATASWHAVVKLGGLVLVVPLIALVGLVQRYRHADPVIRQQIKWLVGGAVLGVMSQFAALPFNNANGTSWVIGETLGAIGQPMVAVGITIGILRYRLWEIDLVVSRAVVFGVVWTALSVLLLVPALAAGLLVGGASALTAVGLALLVTLMFRPTTRRIEQVAIHLVYRRRAQPHVVLTSFWDALRRTGDLDGLGDLLAQTVRSALHVRDAGVWVSAATALRPVGEAARDRSLIELSPDSVAALLASPGVVLSGALPVELTGLWPHPIGALVPLVAGDELVGLLACGTRRGDPLVAADFQLLELLGRESGQRLRNLWLEARLRERLAEIETQAAELSRSRQRLVKVQDEERRRIERNLHDGVQQQLVSLAIRLKRAAGAGDAELADLAVEAEQAVFALQELGRGIFPGVLADQGLAAALRTQVVRMPMAVQIDVQPDVLRHRLRPDLEAALYFVALEALTNAQKHAPTATASVLLRADAGSIVLEVIDDGCGFERRRRPGTGLENMADRIAAVGGVLEISSAPGVGTRVVATVPLVAAPVLAGDVAALPYQPEADSRR